MDEPEIIKLSKEPIKLGIWILLFLLAVWFTSRIINTVLIFSLALLFAYLISPLVSRFSSKRIPGTGKKIPWFASTLIVYLALTGSLVAVDMFFLPLIAAQANAFAKMLPVFSGHFHALTQGLQVWYQKLHIPSSVEVEIRQRGGDFLEKANPLFSTLARNVASGLWKTFTAVLIVLSAFVFSLYMVLEQKKLRENFLEMFPKSWKKDTEELMKNVGHVVGGFIRGILLVSVIMGIVTYLSLLLLKKIGISFDYALLAGLAAGILYPVPFLGVWAPRILAPLLAYFQSGQWSAAFLIFLVLSGVGLVIDNMILPLVMSKGIGISPLMILVVLFAGGELFGLWGLVLGIPAAAVIRLLFFYLQKRISI